MPPPRRAGWVVTRLHARYSKDHLGEDLVFQKAEPIRGGRGMPQGKKGKLRNQSAQKSSRNNFQARYIIRHEWEGDVDCQNPYYRWGGPPTGGKKKTESAGNLAFGAGAKRLSLTSAVDQKSIPGFDSLELKDSEPVTDDESESESEGGEEKTSTDRDDDSKRAEKEQTADEPKQNCRGCSGGTSGGPLGLLWLIAGGLMARRIYAKGS